jgi:hypothetical protein
MSPKREEKWIEEGVVDNVDRQMTFAVAGNV